MPPSRAPTMAQASSRCDLICLVLRNILTLSVHRLAHLRCQMSNPGTRYMLLGSLQQLSSVRPIHDAQLPSVCSAQTLVGLKIREIYEGITKKDLAPAVSR